MAEQIFELFKLHPKTMWTVVVSVLSFCGVLLVAGRAVIHRVRGKHMATAMDRMNSLFSRQDDRIERLEGELMAAQEARLKSELSAINARGMAAAEKARAETEHARAEAAVARERRVKDDLARSAVRINELRQRIAVLENRE